MSAYQLDFARDDGFAGFVRLELRAAARIAWYWTYLVGVPGVPGIIVVRDHEVPLPRQGLEIRAEGLWAELWCETPGEHWTFGLEAFGIRLDHPEDARRAGGEIGERVPVGLDLEWEVATGDDSAATERNAGAEGAPSREMGGVGGAGSVESTHGNVHGDVLVGRERWTIDAHGAFYENAEPARAEGEAIAHVIIPDAGERDLVRTDEGLRWTPIEP